VFLSHKLVPLSKTPAEPRTHSERYGQQHSMVSSMTTSRFRKKGKKEREKKVTRMKESSAIDCDKSYIPHIKSMLFLGNFGIHNFFLFVVHLEPCKNTKMKLFEAWLVSFCLQEKLHTPARKLAHFSHHQPTKLIWQDLFGSEARPKPESTLHH